MELVLHLLVFAKDGNTIIIIFSTFICKMSIPIRSMCMKLYHKAQDKTNKNQCDFGTINHEIQAHQKIKQFAVY